MPVVPELRIEILDDPLKRITALKAGAKNQILRKAVRAAAKPVRMAAKRLAPTDTGVLAASISVRIGTSKKKGTIYAVIGPRRGVSKKRRRGEILAGRPTKYAHLVEFGTRPHSLKSGDKLARRTQAGQQTGGARMHPGAKAKPFLENAYRQTAANAKEDMRRTIAEEVEKRLAKAKAKLRG